MFRKAGRGKTVKPSTHQIGLTNQEWDMRYQALKPGKRVSVKGHVYYEYRKNRSDNQLYR